MLFKDYKKTFGSIGIIAMLCSYFFLIQPKKSEAMVPVIDAAAGAELLAIQAELIEGFHTPIPGSINEHLLQLRLKEVGPAPIQGTPSSYDAIGWFLAKILLRQVTNSIITWIKTGFENNPLFITDWDAFVEDAADQATGVFLKKYFGADSATYRAICSPFRFQILLALSRGRRGYQERMSCTFGTIIGNLENFYSDFNQGGWNAWLTVTNSRNNFYGAVLTSMDELYQQQANARNRAQTESIMNQGFLSMKKCEEYYPVEAARPDETGVERLCKKWTTTSPGRWIEDQLAAVTTSDIRQLELADELNEIIAAAIGQLVSMALTSGAGEGGISEARIPSFAIPSAATTQQQFETDLNNAIRDATAIQTTASTILATLDEAKKINVEAKNCYEGNPNIASANQSAIAEINSAIATIDSQFGPLNTRLTSATDLVNKLEDLRRRWQEFIAQYPQAYNSGSQKPLAVRIKKALVSGINELKKAFSFVVQKALAQTLGPEDVPTCPKGHLAGCITAHGAPPSGCSYNPLVFTSEWGCFGDTNCLSNVTSINCRLTCPGREEEFKHLWCTTGCEVNCQDGGMGCSAGATECSSGGGNGGGGGESIDDATRYTDLMQGILSFTSELGLLQSQLQMLQINPPADLIDQATADRELRDAQSRLYNCQILIGITPTVPSPPTVPNGTGGGNGNGGNGGNGNGW